MLGPQSCHHLVTSLMDLGNLDDNQVSALILEALSLPRSNYNQCLLNTSQVLGLGFSKPRAFCRDLRRCCQ